jgi:hypothetical protein
LCPGCDGQPEEEEHQCGEKRPLKGELHEDRIASPKIGEEFEIWRRGGSL